MGPTKEQVLERLRQVKGPDLKGNIVDLGLVSEILLNNGRVSFSITVPPERASELDMMRQAAEKVLQHWQRDPDFAQVREVAALKRLPEAERQGWRDLWAEVARLLLQAQNKETPTPK